MSAFTTGDLRSETKAYQRDKNHNVKWARGAKAAPGKRCAHHVSWDDISCADCAARPMARDMNRRGGRHYNAQAYNAKQHAQKFAVARKAFRNEVVEATDGPVTYVTEFSKPEQTSDGSTPVMDHEVMYSYDAQTGPAAGHDVLSNAVTQALQRFENKQTENLVKAEYDLVLDGKDVYTTDEDEDDFEMINHAHLQ